MSNSLIFYSYMHRLSHILSLDIVPSDKDIPQMHLRTTGVTETTFQVDSQRYRVFDVVGTRSTSKKWIHTFKQCHQVIFVASLSGYDECLIEDATAVSHDPILRLLVVASWGKSGLSSVQNQTQESLLLFDKILSTSSMEKSTITLLFTKMDLFEHKVKNQSIRDWFPDYVRPGNDSEAGRDFFVQKYLSLNRQPNRKIDVVWADVTDTTSFEPKLRKIMKTPLKARSKHV